MSSSYYSTELRLNPPLNCTCFPLWPNLPLKKQNFNVPCLCLLSHNNPNTLAEDDTVRYHIQHIVQDTVLAKGGTRSCSFLLYLDNAQMSCPVRTNGLKTITLHWYWWRITTKTHKSCCRIPFMRRHLQLHCWWSTIMILVLKWCCRPSLAAKGISAASSSLNSVAIHHPPVVTISCLLPGCCNFCCCCQALLSVSRYHEHHHHHQIALHPETFKLWGGASSSHSFASRKKPSNHTPLKVPL